jgi:hypothetical protein
MLIVYLMIIATQLLLADCCTDDCVEFKDSKNFCSVITNDLQVLSAGYINNATVGTKNVINNQVVDGSVTVLDGADFGDGLVVDGEIIINGIPFVPAFSQYAYFTYEGIAAIANDAIIPLDTDVQSTPGIILNGDGSFTIVNPGIYAINFYFISSGGGAVFALSTVPAGAATKLPNTSFAQSELLGLNGFTIIETTLPNTILGIQNATNAARTPAEIEDNITASVQIFRIQ